MDLSDQRISYESVGLDVAETDVDAIEQFRRWFDEAAASAEGEPYAMVLSTVDDQGRPQGRNVLLRAVDHGFVFYTNYTSSKAKALEATGLGALTFSWLALHRQVHVHGSVARVSDEESDAYFAKRPRDSQLGAWASDQSSPLTGRAELLARVEEATERFEDTDVTRPPFWGGFRVVPDHIEFWQGQPDRLHDRLLYSRVDDAWQRSLLQP